MKQFLDSYYYVTEDGQIWSDFSKKFLSQGKNNGGYATVGIRVNGKKYTMVHNIVAIAYYGDREDMEVDHVNDIRDDNRASNLQWLTKEENMAKCFARTSQVRNFRRCQPLYKGEVIKECDSIEQASRYYSSITGGSYSSMAKYRKAGDYEIKKV
ncbi:HNH endonuclease signature motif containing protein [Bacillus anthracis]